MQIVLSEAALRLPRGGRRTGLPAAHLHHAAGALSRPLRTRDQSQPRLRVSGTGYYASLLAEARGHKVIPSVQTILDLGRRSLCRFALPELNAILAKSLSRLSEPVLEPVSLLIAFGNTADGRFRSFTRACSTASAIRFCGW